MSSNVIKGITIEIGGDVTPLNKALSSVNAESKSIQQELKAVNTLLKFDPSNTEAIAQKQKLLADALENSKTKLNILKQAQAEVEAQFKAGTMGEAEYKAFQNRVTYAEADVKKAEKAIDDFGKECEQSGKDAKGAGEDSEKAGKKAKQSGEDAKQGGSGWEKFGNLAKNAGKVAIGAVTAATTATIAIAKSSIDTGMQFDASMSQVAATMGTTVDKIEELRDFALEMGSTTAFSASQAADALNYMALAGYTTDEAMQALPNVLNLAAAGGTELAQASDMVTDAQSALGLTMEESTKLVNMMAMASSKSNTSVAQLGEAILTVGGTAKTLKGGTNELSTALGILADNGIKGAAGGTALRNIILSLSAPTETAAKAMKSLGLEVFDAAGDMRPLDDVFSDLNGVLSTMTQGEQTQALSDIFNKVDLKSVNALLANSGDRFKELSGYISAAGYSLDETSIALENSGINWKKYKDLAWQAGGDGIGGLADEIIYNIKKIGTSTEELQDYLMFEYDMDSDDAIAAINTVKASLENATGAAEAMANTQIDNLSGDVTMLQSAVEGAKIAISDQLTPSLRGLAQFGTNAVEKLSTAFKKSGLTGAMDTLGEIISEGLAMAVEQLPKMIDVGMHLLGALGRGLLENISVIVDAAIDIVTMLATTIVKNIPTFIDAGLKIIVALINGIASAIPSIVQAIVDMIPKLIQAITDNLPLIINAGITLILSLVQGLLDAIPQLLDALPTIIDSLLNGILSAIPLLIDAGIQLLTSIVAALPDIINKIVEVLPQIITSIIDALMSNLPLIIQAGIDLLIALVKALPTIITTIVKAIPQIITSIINALVGNIDKIIMAGVQIFVALIQNLPTIIVEIVKAIPQIIKGIIDAIISFVPKIAECGSNLIKGLWNGIKDAGAWLWDRISGFFGGIVNGIKDFFGIHSPSTLFRDMIGKNLIKGIEVGVDVETPNLQENLESNLSAATSGLKASIEAEEMKLNVMSATTPSGSGSLLGGFSLNIDTFINNTEKDIQQITEEFMYSAEEYIKRKGGVFA